LTEGVFTSLLYFLLAQASFLLNQVLIFNHNSGGGGRRGVLF